MRALVVLLCSALLIPFSTVPGADAAAARPDLAALGPSVRPDTTMQIRDALTHSSSMTPAQREDAVSQFTRPVTDDYSCLDDVQICLHSNDATYPSCHVVDHVIPADPNCWLDQVKQVAEYVATTYQQAGYRSPKPDNGQGDEGIPNDPAQSGYTDIYLQDLGSQGLYGFTSVDAVVKNGQLQPVNGDAHGDLPAFLELDAHFSQQQFGTRSTPLQALEVTLAHEFFHAVQFAYDFYNDRWLMEATAVWAEDELYTDVNDNLQYLPYSQLRTPGTSLDDNDGNGGSLHYGDWSFIRYLTEHIPATTGPLPNLVLQIWQLCDSLGSNDYSTQAIVAAVRSRGIDFTKLFAQYADALHHPAISWSEGAANDYPTAPVAARATLRPTARSRSGSFRIDHLASATVRLTPHFPSPRAKLRLSVQMARRSAGSGAVVSIFFTDGSVATHVVPLAPSGRGRAVVGFSSHHVRFVELTLANAGHRFRCWKSTDFSCQGTPLNDQVVENWSATAS